MLPAARNGIDGSAIFSEPAWHEVARSLGLTSSELQIVRGVFDDRVESAIAADPGISPHRVHTHFERLHRKLGVTTRTGLVLGITRQFLTLAARVGPGRGRRRWPGLPSGGTWEAPSHVACLLHRNNQEAGGSENELF